MTKEEKQKKFYHWWQMLPNKEVAEKRSQIIKRCFISSQVWHYWLTGKTEIPALAIPVIEEVAGKKIFSKNDD